LVVYDEEDDAFAVFPNPNKLAVKKEPLMIDDFNDNLSYNALG